MQTVLQVISNPGPSLRERIADDPFLSKYGLQVEWEHQAGRQPGWMKLHGLREKRFGAINVEWDGATSILTCRIVNRGTRRPHLLIGDLVSYLLARLPRRRVKAITILT